LISCEEMNVHKAEIKHQAERARGAQQRQWSGARIWPERCSPCALAIGASASSSSKSILDVAIVHLPSSESRLIVKSECHIWDAVSNFAGYWTGPSCTKPFLMILI
jgi:hypothetical protein